MQPDVRDSAIKGSIALTGATATGLTAHVDGPTFLGLTLNQWVAAATLIFIIMQAGLLVPKYWRLIRAWIRCRSPE